MSTPPDIFWIGGDSTPGIAIVLRPRGGDWLEDELDRMKRGGIEVLVSLLEADEALELGLKEEAEIATKAGLQFLSFPIPDRHVPQQTFEFRRFAGGLADRLRAGQTIGVHCRGSIGRASVTAACSLIHLGWKAEAAMEAIQAARGCIVPDTQEQWDWVLDYEVQA